MKIVWKEIKDFDNYRISSDGRIKSLNGNGRPNLIMKTKINPRSGYEQVELSSRGKHYTKKVHILVADAFLNPKPKWATMVNHQDFNKRNNAFKNLEWSTNSLNQKHAYKVGGRKPTILPLKLSQMEIECIRRVFPIVRICELSRIFGVSSETIRAYLGRVKGKDCRGKYLGK